MPVLNATWLTRHDVKRRRGRPPKRFPAPNDEQTAPDLTGELDRPLPSSLKSRGTVAMVKALTDNGWEILKFWNDVYKGQVEGMQGATVRMEASVRLFERGFGKPVETTVLIDATRMEEEAQLRHVPTEELHRILSTFSPPPDTAVGKLDSVERIPMPDVTQGAKMGAVVDAEFEALSAESPRSEVEAAKRSIVEARLERAALEAEGLLKPEGVKVYVKQRNTRRKFRTQSTSVEEPVGPMPSLEEAKEDLGGNE